MCDNCDCYQPNKPATLTLADQSSLWADIKAARIALQARQSFLEALGMDLATQGTDSKLIALESLTAGLWARFRVL